MTYLKFTKDEFFYRVSILKQKIEIDMESYTIQSIYVSDNLLMGSRVNINNNNDSSNEDSLCLICFAEERNLVNLPCGHSCIGDACVKLYFEQGDSRACPICRKGK